MDSELERRGLIEDYTIRRKMDAQRAEIAKEDSDRILDLQRERWRRDNYSAVAYPEDTNYPIDGIARYPYGERYPDSRISSLKDPFDERRWGRESASYWRNRNRQNTTPMVLMVDPPF